MDMCIENLRRALLDGVFVWEAVGLGGRRLQNGRSGLKSDRLLGSRLPTDDFDVADQLRRIAAVAIRCSLVLQFPL